MAEYRNYSEDKSFMRRYLAHHDAYKRTPRESDKALAKLLLGIPPEQRRTVLDIGCGNGSLLAYLRTVLSNTSLMGGDLSEVAVAACRQAPDLTGVTFDRMDLLALPADRRTDVVILNAVAFSLPTPVLTKAVGQVRSILNPNGWLVMWDWMTPFDHDMAIHETSADYPTGVTMHVRGYPTIRSIVGSNGFHPPSFTPFEIPIDIPRRESLTDMGTYTVQTDMGRMCFRGAQFQPWCFLMAQRA